MTITRVLAGRCALLSVPVLLAGCSSTEAPAPSVAPTTTPAATPTLDAEQRAVDEATALVPVYWQTLDGLFADAAQPIDGIYAVAVDPEATTMAATIQAFRSSGLTQSGVSRVVTTAAGAVDLATSGGAGDLPSVQISACIDVTGVGATDASGASVAPAEQAPYLISELTIVNTAYPDPSSWRVSSAPNIQAQACPD